MYVKGDRLRAEIAIRGVDHQTFARVAGISAATLSHACTGGRISGTTLRKLAQAIATMPQVRHAEDLVAIPGRD